jgi:Xaa-Pro dipeptidase
MGKPWNQKHLAFHKKAAIEINSVLKSIPGLMHPNISEKDIQIHIIDKFKERKLNLDKKDVPIVAFNKNTAVYDCVCSARNKLKKNSLILVDLWVGVKKGPFADVTWMFYYGKNIPKDILKIFSIVVKCRNQCFKLIKEKLKKKIIPSGCEITKFCQDFMQKHGYFKESNHPFGHSLGFYSAHGNNSNISINNKKPLKKNLAYSFEPGIYLRNKFGIRLELNFYIDPKYKLVITTPLQRQITLVKQ